MHRVWRPTLSDLVGEVLEHPTSTGFDSAVPRYCNLVCTRIRIPRCRRPSGTSAAGCSGRYATHLCDRGRDETHMQAYTMDNLLSINHGQRPGVELMNVETIYPTDASNLQAIKYDVSGLRLSLSVGLKRQYITGVKVHVLDVGCRPDSAPASWERVKSIHEAMMKWE